MPARPPQVPLQRPIGPLQSWLQHKLGSTFAVFNKLLAPTPPGQWLHRRLRHGLELTALDVPVSNGSGPLEPLSIAFLSDLHAGPFMRAADINDLAERVAALHPDLVLLGGDLVDTRWEQVRLFEEAFAILDPRLGIWAVPGNHEYYRKGDVERWAAYLSERGVEVLTNRGVRIDHDGETLWLAGVDDLTVGEPDLDAALAGRRPGEPTILLSHHPDVFLEASRRDVQLQLSGHTHGGQVRLFGWTPLDHSNHGWLEGRHQVNGSTLYVGRGAGVTVLPLRIGVRAEVTLVRVT